MASGSNMKLLRQFQCLQLLLLSFPNVISITAPALEISYDLPLCKRSARPRATASFLHANACGLKSGWTKIAALGRAMVRSAIDGRTTRHEGYGMSQSCRAMIECIFGWGKQHGTMRKTKHRGPSQRLYRLHAQSDRLQPDPHSQTADGLGQRLFTTSRPPQNPRQKDGQCTNLQVLPQTVRTVLFSRAKWSIEFSGRFHNRQVKLPKSKHVKLWHRLP